MKNCIGRILSIGAHPDDADTSAGGLLQKLYHKGWTIQMLSVTDGSAGTYDASKGGAELAEIRKKEAQKSGDLVDGSYDVWDIEDGRLENSIVNRERLIRYIRKFAPNIIVVNRPNDYHPDHRTTSVLVADASYLLTIPYICSDVQSLTRVPVILYWEDGFERPYAFQKDIIVPIDGYVEKWSDMACCHESQYFDWMYWPDRMECKEWSREKQIEGLKNRYKGIAERRRKAVEKQLLERYGEEKASQIQAVEFYEVCEFGEALTEELKTILEE